MGVDLPTPVFVAGTHWVAVGEYIPPSGFHDSYSQGQDKRGIRKHLRTGYRGSHISIYTNVKAESHDCARRKQNKKRLADCTSERHVRLKFNSLFVARFAGAKPTIPSPVVDLWCSIFVKEEL